MSCYRQIKVMTCVGIRGKTDDVPGVGIQDKIKLVDLHIVAGSNDTELRGMRAVETRSRGGEIRLTV